MNICVYAASSEALEKPYFEAAFLLGRLIAEGGHRLVYGGGATGLMGACARGVLSGGGAVLGIAPRFFDEPGVLLREGCKLSFTESMAERKTAMAAASDAFIALPGGIGTYEEFFETLTLKQLGLHDKPMALVNTLGCYAPLQFLLESAAEKGFMSRGVLGLYALCDTPEEALAHVCADAERGSSARGIESYNK